MLSVSSGKTPKSSRANPALVYVSITLSVREEAAAFGLRESRETNEATSLPVADDGQVFLEYIPTLLEPQLERVRASSSRAAGPCRQTLYLFSTRKLLILLTAKGRAQSQVPGSHRCCPMLGAGSADPR